LSGGFDAHVAELMGGRNQELAEPAMAMARAGLKKVVDFQDIDYAAEYLDILGTLHAADWSFGGADRNFAFTQAAAKYLANAMTYDDVIRVADLKTRSVRRAGVENDQERAEEQDLETTESVHARPGGARHVRAPA